MPLGIVGVRGVRHVARRNDRTGAGAEELLASAAPEQDDPFEDGVEQFREGAAVGHAADLLVIEQGEERHRATVRCDVFRGVEQGVQSGVAGA